MKQQMQQNKIEWKEVEIGELLDYEQPGKYIIEGEILKEKIKSSVPVLTANKSFILGYTEEKEGIYNNPPVILFDDFTTDTKFVDFKFKVKSSAMKLLRPKSKDINLKFVFLMMKGIQLNFSTHKRYYLSVYRKRNILMPFSNGKPDIKEQKRIVKILDDTWKLNEGGEKIESLFDEYLRTLFYEMFYNKGFEIKGFLDVFNITTGKLDSNAMEENGRYPFFTCSQETFKINAPAFDCEALLLAGNNASAKYSVKYYKGKFNAYQRTYVLTLKKGGDFRYMHFVLTNKLKELQRKSIGTNTKYLTLGILKTLDIPLPPLPLQQKFARIVEQVEKMKETINKTKQNSEELFNSLVSKAFRGEL